MTVLLVFIDCESDYFSFELSKTASASLVLMTGVAIFASPPNLVGFLSTFAATSGVGSNFLLAFRPNLPLYQYVVVLACLCSFLYHLISPDLSQGVW